MTCYASTLAVGRLTPELLSDTPEKRWPELKNFNFAMKVINGFVKIKTTSKSTRVVKPSVNAKP
jgi:hypothetical protein